MGKNLKRFIVVSFASAFMLAISVMSLEAGQRPAAQGPVILTLSGAIENWNRGPLDPKLEGFFKHHDIKFERALEMSRDEMSGLPSVRLSLRLPGEAKPATYDGVYLRDVLLKAGAKPKKISMKALDGYTVELTAEQIAAQKWVLALARGGKPLGIGGRGPVWLVHKPGKGDQASEEEEQKWIWSLFYILVE